MELIEALRREHAIIERVTSALVRFAEARARGEGDPTDAARFAAFFTRFAGKFHHAREDGVLFAALVEHTEVSRESGPIAVLLADHEELEAAALAWSSLDGAALLDAATRYASKLLHHIDAENSVLFPECESRFRRVSLLELDDREPDEDERAARDLGAPLVERYGAADFVDPSRGDGCVCCPAFGVRCDGVEREWSSDAEWEDMIERVGR